MKSKTEELLYMLLWGCDMLRRPTFRNLTDSFESWAYRNGFERKLLQLEKKRFLESQVRHGTPTRFKNRIFRLTNRGKLHALGGRDPEKHWAQEWDGLWRMVLFDFPNALTKERDHLRRYLRQKGFGYLQNSVWIKATPIEEELKDLASLDIDVESLIFLNATPGGGESHAEIVAGAWDFPTINDRYERYLRILGTCPSLRRRKTPHSPDEMRQWANEERKAWILAFSIDPLLPKALWPAGYLGRKAWQKKLEAMQSASEFMRRFKRNP